MPWYFEERIPNTADYWANTNRTVASDDFPVPDVWLYPIFEEDYILDKNNNKDISATKKKLINIYQMTLANWEKSLARSLFDSYHDCHTKGFTVHAEKDEVDLIGMELELAARASKYKKYLNDSATYFKTLRQYNKDFFVECDKSIVTGFELITQPYSFKRFNQEFLPLLSNILTNVKRFGAENNWPVAALHLHVNRKCFGENKEQQINNLTKIQWLFSNSAYQIYELTDFVLYKDGRCKAMNFKTYKDCENYVTSVYANPNKNQPQRKMIINYLNAKTIEFRCFNSTTDIQLITNIVKLIQYICNKSKTITGTAEELASLDYWFKDCKDKELKDFILKKEA